MTKFCVFQRTLTLQDVNHERNFLLNFYLKFENCQCINRINQLRKARTLSDRLTLIQIIANKIRCRPDPRRQGSTNLTNYPRLGTVNMHVFEGVSIMLRLFSIFNYAQTIFNVQTMLIFSWLEKDDYRIVVIAYSFCLFSLYEFENAM